MNFNCENEILMEKFLEEKVKASIRDIKDFPRKGILFKDLTTLFKNGELLSGVVETLYEYYKDKKITKVAGIESRGFIAGGALAVRLGAGFIPVRKPGKLPAETFRKEYNLEYGTDSVEIHKDAINNDDIILLHDDLLATGGTSRATYDLISLFKPKAVYINFIVELEFLKGRDNFSPGTEIYAMIRY